MEGASWLADDVVRLELGLPQIDGHRFLSLVNRESPREGNQGALIGNAVVAQRLGLIQSVPVPVPA